MSSPLRHAGLLPVGMVLLFPLLLEAAAPGPVPRLVAHVYPVADLIVPMNALAAGQRPGATLHRELVQLIQSSVSPRSWSSSGGPGRLDFFPIGMALVVHQTPQVHEEVAHLLAALRRLQDVEVTLEIRLIAISPATLQRLGIAGDDAGAIPGVAHLDEAQVRLLLEAIHADQHGSVLQLPRLTMFNGQQADLDLSEKQAFITGVEMVQQDDRQAPQPRVNSASTDFRVSVLPVVAADRKSVTVQLALDISRKGDPHQTDANAQATPRRRSRQSLARTVKLTDGGTALLSGWTQQRQTRQQVLPPVLSKIPYLSRLLDTVSYGKEMQQVLVMVTPRIVVHEEKEESGPMPTIPARTETESEPSSDDCPRTEEKSAEQTQEPPEARPEEQYVNSRAFEVAYQMDQASPERVRAIEVWWTRDARTWHLYPDEVRPTGKVPVISRADGRFGFTLVPRGVKSSWRRPPATGELPQCWIVVDTKKPTFDVLKASRPAKDGTILLAWSCADEHLGDRPVSLHWSAHPDGPWRLLAGQLPARGKEHFSTRELPGHFYLRGEVVDRAGNQRALVLPESIDLERTVPVIRALGARPLH